jgi:parallel beta-helix repeat protein
VKKKKMNTKKVMLGMAIATMFLIAAVVSASALPICPAPGNTPITSSCELNQSYAVSAGQHGYKIDGNDIVIDGKGLYFLNGSSAGGAGMTAGIYSKAPDTTKGNNITIKNLEIKNFCNGIYIGGTLEEGACTYKAEEGLIENCEIHHNDGTSNVMGIKSTCMNNLTIRDCEIYNNSGGETGGMACEYGGNGIFIKCGWYNKVLNNEIYENERSGVFTKGGPRYTEIADNTIYRNNGGIVLRCKNSNYHTITNNTVEYNVAEGIFIGGCGNTLQNNVVKHTVDGSGIVIGRCGEAGWCRDLVPPPINTIDGNNTVCENDVMDISVATACIVHVEGDENTCNTTEFYNDNGMSQGCDYACIISCDTSGNEKNTFLVNEKVYVKGGGHALSTSLEYKLWIQDDPVTDSDELIAGEDPSQTQEAITPTDCGGVPCFGPTEIWDTTGYAGTLKHCDIIVDNQTGGTIGTFNKATDGIDSATVTGFVAPIPEMATIALFGIGLMMLVGYVRLRGEKN